MEIPQALRDALQQQLMGLKQEQMVQDAQRISLRYRTQNGTGARLLTRDSEAVAYAAARMPATFGAVSAALQHALAAAECRPETLLDVGAGTGAAAWAAEAALDLKCVTCLEREDAMRKVGQALMQQGSAVLRQSRWIRHDLTTDEVDESADLVVASYVLNELSDAGRAAATKKLWSATKMMLLLVEPGTPAGFAHLKEARQMLLSEGAHVAAPCPHEGECPKTTADWCHFSCRVSRSRLHRQLKGGEAPYEDEKFIYMALTREDYRCSGARVLRHPQVRSGHVMLEICTADGVQQMTLSKKDGERYKQARKAESGDLIQREE